MQYYIAICDDDTQDIQIIEEAIVKVLKTKEILFSIKKYLNPYELLDQMENKDVVFHIVFLDILMDGINGIQLANKIRRINKKVDIVFITTSSEYALESFNTYPLQYLLKPIDPEKLLKTIEKSISFWRLSSTSLLVKSRFGQTLILVNDIDYVEVYRHTIKFHMKDDICVCSGNLSDIEKRLPKEIFVRCHKSYIVNMSQISEIKRYSISLRNGLDIPIGRPRYAFVQTSFVEFAIKNSPLAI